MTPPTAHLDAARLFGCKVDEIAAAERTADGDLLVTTVDGIRDIVVPEANPDGAGRHGILLFELPAGFTEGAQYPVPLFTPRRPAAAEPAAEDTEDAPSAAVAAPADESTDEAAEAQDPGTPASAPDGAADEPADGDTPDQPEPAPAPAPAKPKAGGRRPRS